MYVLAFATDYDETIADEGIVSEDDPGGAEKAEGDRPQADPGDRS